MIFISHLLECITMAISKKTSSDKQNLKLVMLENNFYHSLTALTDQVIRQENRLSKTLDNLKVKLKEAIAKQKLIKKSKKNLTPALEKQQMKAQITVDSLELQIALTTDQLNLMTAKADHLSSIVESYEAPKPSKKPKTVKTTKKASPKTKVVIVTKSDKTNKSDKADKKASKLPKKSKSTKTAKTAKIAKPEVEQFDFEELFTPDMAPLLEEVQAQSPDSSVQI